MGASRKLQAEIDRVLKKVQEGVQLFDTIWNKVYDTDNANQKDKFEADLKKEIKKLQRCRDQIKTWMQSSEIKDKKVSASYEQSLLDARKQIEREMERFKICEKEAKTKAFSKEGLGQQPKADPKEKAKIETRDWINNVVGALEFQVDNFEAEIESLTVKKGKNRPPRLTHLETSITRHKAHIMKLELVLRLLENDELSPEQVNDIKDFLEDYVERNQDDFDEFSDVDELYEILPLDKVEALEDLVAISQPSLVKAVVAPQQSTTPLEQLGCVNSMDINSNGVLNTPSKSSLVSTSSVTSPVGSVTNFIPVSDSSQPPGTPASMAASIPVSAPGIIESEEAYISSSTLNVTTLPAEDDSLKLLGQRASSTFTGSGVVEAIEMPIIRSQSDHFPLNSEPAVPSQGLAIGVIPLTSNVGKNDVSGVDEKLSSSLMLQPTLTSSIKNWVPQSTSLADRNDSADSGYEGYPPFSAGGTFTSSIAPSMSQCKPGFQNQNEMGQHRGRIEIDPDQREKFLQRLQQVNQPRPVNLLGMQNLGGSDSIQVTGQKHNPYRQQQNLPRQTSRRGVIGRRVIDELGGSDDNIKVSTSSTGNWYRDDDYNSKMLESALYKLPRPRDSELIRTSTPKCPAVAPPSYPKVQAPIVNNPELWNRMACLPEGYDTLFFAFYYQQNTYQQFLAAKALMNHAWRFHTKHKTWFQRHGEPVEATDDYERGSYIYFDFHAGSDEHEPGWCRRMKQDFTFEYAFLEDQFGV